ncbi:hypothetical protein [Ferrimonas marina]|uniref:hypothetical protein n=1 Tax=Ferrimonas marina TaxID=299255 RepID=UPI0008302052|nr:hypothetical protein [Ferrimonas marina]
MNLDKAHKIEEILNTDFKHEEFLLESYDEAKKYINDFDWHKGIKDTFVGMCFDGILCVFLFDCELTIEKELEGDNFVWVIVGDLPPAYITSENAPNPACALDGYVGAMLEWVKAAASGDTVDDLIPVNVPANPENSELLKRRLDFIDKEILSAAEYKEDLRA